MVRFGIRTNNDILAILAIVLIIMSTVNVFAALEIKKMKETVTAKAATAEGIISLCSSDIPEITASSYFETLQDDGFFYDVNATGEGGTDVSYTDNTSMFDIGTYTGTINFTPNGSYVGMHDVLLIATESFCSSTNATITRFNITNKNDPPYLISLVLQNATSSGNATYNFPITQDVDIYEDFYYNLSVIAYDPDFNNPPPYTESLTYGKIPPGLFVLNPSDGKVTFMPVQSEVGTYSFRFNVRDLQSEIDESNWVTLVVHNTNDNPVLENKSELGQRTSLSGARYVFDLNATDEDPGDTLFYNVTFIWCNQTFRNLTEQNCSIFFPNSSTGVIDFTPVLLETGNYTINYTVTDGNGGWDWHIGNFTVVESSNSPPNITDWWPVGNVTMDEGTSQLFNITVVDPDSIIDSSNVYWYLDGQLVQTNSFEYTFSPNYQMSGVYNITVVVDDGWFLGALTDSHYWQVIVLEAEPPHGPPSPSGTLGKSYTCVENWRCTAWSECEKSGTQTRTCVDLADCGTTTSKPTEIKYCIYTPQPTCFDGIQNCHGGLCEILADCGGPCQTCPTCSDGIQNCHANGECEENVDCGGPCKPCVVPPDVPVCGNSICEAGELSGCMEDCLDFWIDMMIFVVILILLIITSILLYIYRKETVLLFVYRKMRGEDND